MTRRAVGGSDKKKRTKIDFVFVLRRRRRKFSFPEWRMIVCGESEQIVEFNS
jgi:hypothetical protein